MLDSAITRLYQQIPHGEIDVAVSGGLDSLVLLHAMKQHLDDAHRLRAVHINHHLSPQANDWVTFLEGRCKEWQIPLMVRSIDLSKVRGNLEAEARRLRYQAIHASQSGPHPVITAHHRDDQVETILLRLFCGSDWKGLRGMEQRSNVYHLIIYRPLLDVTRAELSVYARHHGITWIEDPSNHNHRFDRNFIRHQVLPLLEQRWPSVRRTIEKLGQRSRDIHNWMDAAVAQWWPQLWDQRLHALCLDRFRALAQIQQSQVMRFWFQQLDCPAPPSTYLQEMVRQVLLAKRDAQVALSWRHYCLLRYQNRIYLEPKLVEYEPHVAPLDISLSSIDVAGRGRLYWQWCRGQGIRWHQHDRYTLRWRMGGESIRPHGGMHRKRLKSLLQSWQIPPWRRQQIPLVYHEDELVAVAGYCHSDAHWVDPQEEGLQFSWVPAWSG